MSTHWSRGLNLTASRQEVTCEPSADPGVQEFKEQADTNQSGKLLRAAQLKPLVSSSRVSHQARPPVLS